MSLPTLEFDVSEIVLRTPYDEDFVEALKQLPREARRWDAQAKVWRVDLDHVSHVRDLMLRHWNEIAVVNDPDEGDHILDASGTIHQQFGLF